MPATHSPYSHHWTQLPSNLKDNSSMRLGYEDTKMNNIEIQSVLVKALVYDHLLSSPISGDHMGQRMFLLVFSP